MCVSFFGVEGPGCKRIASHVNLKPGVERVITYLVGGFNPVEKH